MHLFNCLDPVAVKDHDGNTRYVPCGKCDYCRYVRSLGRIDRATNELRKHKYALLVTLSYHDAFLPLVVLNHDYGLMYFRPGDDIDNFSDTPDGQVTDYSVPNVFEKNLYNRISRRYGGVPVLYKPHIQGFLKRLRSRIKYQLAKNDKEKYLKDYKITYSYCGEYGPSTYRPHYHIILMFDSAELYDYIRKSLYSLWEFGTISQRLVNTSEEDAHYTAQYANGINRLPTLYRQKMVAPFYETSRNGSFGFAKISEEEIERIHNTGSCRALVQDMLSGEYKSVSTPLYLANKLFPRFSGFNLLSRNGVIELLRLCQKPFVHSPSDLVPVLLDHCRDHEHYDISKWYNVFLRGDYMQLLRDVGDYEQVSRSSRRILSLSKSIYYTYNAYVKLHYWSHADLYFLVDRTFDYLDNVSKQKLNDQFLFEDTFYLEHPDWLVFLDSTSPSPPVDVMMQTEFGTTIDFITKSINHSHKNKRKNEYLAAHPEYKYIKDFDEICTSIANDGIV